MKEVMEIKKPIIIPDVYADERPNHNVCRNFGIKGLYMFPLVSLGEVLGQISVVNLGEEEILYSDAQVQLAQSVMDATAST